MALLLEEGEKALADLVRGAHRAAIVRRGIPPPRVVGSSCASPPSEALPLSPAPAHAGRRRDRARRARRCVGGRTRPRRRSRRPRRRRGRRRSSAVRGEARRRGRARAPARRRLAAPAHVLAGAARHRPRSSSTGRRGACSGRRNAHERRHVASTTKIMTALLALRKLQPHDIVTVDKSVPRVPLVREGLRAGERVAGVEALLLAPPLLGQRRRARACDRRGRRQVDVHPVDERRGEDARAARHALLDAERRRGRRQLLERVGSRSADAGRDAEPSASARSCKRASST